MKNALLILSIILYGCAAVPVHKSIEINNKPLQYSISSNIDSVWNRIINYSIKNNHKTKNKHKSDGIVDIEINESILTCLDKKGSKINQKAYAITDERKRINNGNYVYPYLGNLEYKFSLIRKAETETDVFIELNNICLVTSYYENTFLRKRPIPNVKVWTTGLFENLIVDFVKNE